MAPTHPNKQPPTSIVEPPTSSTSTADSSTSSASTTESSPSITSTSATPASTSETPTSTPGYSYPSYTTPPDPNTPGSASTLLSLQTGTTQTPADTTPSPAAASSSSAAAAASASSYPGTTTSTVTTGSTSNLNAGAIAGGTIGGIVVLALLILGLILCRRARRRKHIAPSSEFAETIKRGELPVLRLDCGVEIVPSAVQHHIPLPLKQDSYYTSPTMSDMKLPDGMGGSDEQSVRYSLEKPLQPLRRYPDQQDSNESMKMGQAPARRVSSIGSSQELWSRDAGKFDIRKDYRSISPLPATDISYAPLMQNTYPMEPSGAVETLQNAYVDLWKLSVAPITQSRPDSVWNGAGTQPLPPLVPVRRSVDVSQRRF